MIFPRFVTHLYECPPCPKGQECKECNPPHFYIADRSEDQHGDKSLIVVDYPEKPTRVEEKRILPPKIKVGDLVIVNGLFAKRSATGFAASNGLIVYEGVKPVTD